MAQCASIDGNLYVHGMIKMFLFFQDDASFNPFMSDDKEVVCENRDVLLWLLEKIEKSAQLCLGNN